MLKEQHEQRLEELYRKRIDSEDLSSLKQVRMQAWKRAVEIGLPDQKSEGFRQGGLKVLYDTPLRSVDETVEPSPLKGTTPLPIRGGEYEPTEGSIDGAIVLPLQEAWKEYGLFLQNRFQQLIRQENNPMMLINTALHQGGVFIYIPANKQVEVPLELLLTPSTKGPYAAPFVQVYAASGSQVSIVETNHYSTTHQSVTNGYFDFALESGARVDYYAHLPKVEQPVIVHNYRGTLKGKSQLNMLMANAGSQLYQQNFHMELQGEESEVSLRGIWALEGKARSSTNVLIQHRAPNCRSNQHFKGIVKDRSRSAFDGKIYVFPEAQKTEAYQLNNNLVLSEGASAFTKPNLEIFADDVKASHGATVAQLSEDEMFYMQTRGIKPSDAKKQLVVGFLDALTKEIPLDDLKSQVRRSYLDA